MSDLTPLGELLEQAREKLGVSKREAARRAGISEGRWRQVVTGQQKAGANTIPANPRRITVAAMARAVGVDENRALGVAGLEPLDADEFVRLVQNFPRGTGDPLDRQIAEIYSDPRIPDDRKLELVRILRRAEADRRTVDDEIRHHREAG